MNSIFLLLALGSLNIVAPWKGPIVVSENALLNQPRASSEPEWIYQQSREVVWPKLDPRDPSNSTLGSKGVGAERASSTSGKAPAIRGAQLNEDVPNYEKPDSRKTVTESTPPTMPQKNIGRRAESDERAVEPSRETGRSKFSGGNPREVDDERLVDSSKPRFGESARQSPSEREEPFTPTTARLKTSVMRQSGGSRESAPSPFEFRPASISDDPEVSQRGAPYKSFAVGTNDEEDDLGAEPYNAPLPSGRRGDERLASNRGDSRDTNSPAEDGGDSTLQGGKRVPGSNPESSIWGSLVLVLLLFASMGGNLYLAWVAREFYERYRSLAQQVRSARNNLT